MIKKHASEIADGQTYAQLEQDDPRRESVMTSSFLRASLFTSVVAFGVAALVVGARGAVHPRRRRGHVARQVAEGSLRRRRRRRPSNSRRQQPGDLPPPAAGRSVDRHVVATRASSGPWRRHTAGRGTTSTIPVSPRSWRVSTSSCAASVGSWSRSAAEPTRPSSPPSPPASLGRDRVHAVTAVSPSLAGEEEADCRTLAEEWDLRWTPVATDEMERAAYRVNDTDRCFHCKAELMDVVAPIAAARGCGRRARGERRRPRRPPARTEGGGGRRCRVPARRRRLHEGRRPGGVAPARTAHVGQAGGRLPRQPGAVRHGGDGRPARADRSRRVGVAPPRLPAGPGAALRRDGAYRGRPRRNSPR